MGKEINLNSPEFAKMQKDRKTKSGNAKKVNLSGLNVDSAKKLVKNNFIQVAIFLLCFFAITGLISSFIFLFTHTLYFLGWIAVGIILFIFLKKKIKNIKL